MKHNKKPVSIWQGYRTSTGRFSLQCVKPSWLFGDLAALTVSVGYQPDQGLANNYFRKDHRLDSILNIGFMTA